MHGLFNTNSNGNEAIRMLDWPSIDSNLTVKEGFSTAWPDILPDSDDDDDDDDGDDDDDDDDW